MILWYIPPFIFFFLTSMFPPLFFEDIIEPSSWVCYDLLTSHHFSLISQILKSARQLGDFLLVGIHTDQIVRYILLIHDLTQVHGCFATFPWLFVKFGSCTSYSLSFSNKKKINNDNKLFRAVNTGGIRIQLCIYMSVVLVCWLAVMLMKLSLVHLGKLQLTWCVIFFLIVFSKMGIRLSWYCIM